VSLTYSGTNYEVAWAGVKNQSITYDVRHSTAGSIRTIGWSSATSDGTSTNTGDDYTGVFKTFALAEAPFISVGIRPRMTVTAATAATPIQITTGVGHSLVTGMTVSVAGVCANANGTKTVTVVNRTQFTLNGTASPCAYGGSGGTVTTTSESEGFYEISSR